MVEPDLRLQKYLEDYVEFWDRLSSRSIELLDNLCAHNFSFADPYHSTAGVQDAKEILKHRQKVFNGGRYHVYDFMWGRRDATGYMHWSFTYSPKKKFMRKIPDDVVIGGVSKLMFTPDGELLSHEDFFAAHNVEEIGRYKDISA